MKKYIVIVLAILAILGFAIQSCEATENLTKEQKQELGQHECYDHEYGCAICNNYRITKSLESRIEELERGNYPERYTFKGIKFRVDRPAKGVSKVTVEK